VPVERVVVVAFVVVELLAVKLARVDDALETKPFPKTRVVEVDSSLVPSLVNGKTKVRGAVLASEPLVNERPVPIARGPTLPSAPM
jgi:hypothetical protein